MSALLLALLKMHPPGPEVQNDRSWLCTAPVNARAFIKEPYQSYRELYFPACQANGFAVFDDMKSFAQDGQREDEKTKELLARASRQAKNWLEKLRTRPHSLALATSIMEMITTMYARYGLSSQLSLPFLRAY